MRIHGICLLKNEADIVRYSLTQNARWCDRIYVYDNGSTDGTMDVVRDLAKQNGAIIDAGKTSAPFADSLRSDVFNRTKGDAQPGDWWCRLDADEIYVDDVRAFLAQVPSACHLVWSVYLQYYITTADLERLEPFVGKPAPEMTAENLPRYYRADYAEPKFFRHRPGLHWGSGSWPDHVGLVAPQMLKHQHFQYRSPAQIEKRLATRKEAASHGWSGFPHSHETNWREKVRPTDGLHLDTGDGNFIIEESALPRHLEPQWQRLMKRVLHGTGIWA